ncbi:MAG: RNA polymerase sigma factor [Thermoanaerobaculia bacterium]
MLDLDTLIARCRQGDELAWEALVRRYQGRVFGVALHYLRDREEARDAAQDAFVKLYRNLSKLEGGETFLPWLLRITRNCAIDRMRRNAVRRPPAEAPEEDAAETSDPGPSAEEALFRDARKALVYRALGALSEHNREVILLKDIEQRKLEEIAEILDLPLGTVKSRTNRARLQLAAAVRRLDPSYGG